MSDNTKMILGVLGFFALLIIAGITRSEALAIIVVAIVCYVAGAILSEPYKVIAVKPRERKSVEVERMEVKE